MQVDEWSTGALSLDPNNARKHSERDLLAIKASLLRFGQQTPIVIRADGRVIKGNGTLLAIQSLNWPTVKVVVTDLSDDALTAYAIADNRTGELSEWRLDDLIASLGDMDEALRDAVGFDSEDLAAMGLHTQPLDASSGLDDLPIVEDSYSVVVQCKAVDADSVRQIMEDATGQEVIVK